jgi:hypothetical protein
MHTNRHEWQRAASRLDGTGGWKPLELGEIAA